MKRVTTAVLLLALLGVAACCACPTSSSGLTTTAPTRPAQPLGRTAPARAFDRERERRAVMRVILTERYGKGAKRFVLDPELVEGVRLPSDRTLERMRTKGRKLPESIELADGRRVRAPSIEGLDARLIADWAAHGMSSPTPRDFDLPLPIHWFTDADRDALKGVVVTGELAYESPKWQAFHLRHPDSAGWISLSNVGFSPSGDQALIYASSSSGSLSGAGYWYLLEKRAGRWAVVVAKLVWVS